MFFSVFPLPSKKKQNKNIQKQTKQILSSLLPGTKRLRRRPRRFGLGRLGVRRPQRLRSVGFGGGLEIAGRGSAVFLLCFFFSPPILDFTFFVSWVCCLFCLSFCLFAFILFACLFVAVSFWLGGFLFCLFQCEKVFGSLRCLNMESVFGMRYIIFYWWFDNAGRCGQWMENAFCRKPPGFEISIRALTKDWH